MTVDWNKGIIIPHPSETAAHWVDIHCPLPFDDLQSRSICNLLNRSWFQRLWILQQVILARDVMVACGSHLIPWEAIRVTIFCCSQKLQIPERGVAKPPYQLLLGLCMTEKMASIDDLFSLMFYTRQALCSDPRDRVFAILSLLNQPLRVHLPSDYTRTSIELYRDVVVQYMNSGYIRHLSSVELQDGFQATPLWVPDWSKPITVTERIWHANAAADFRLETRVLDFATLQITGAYIADIGTAQAFNFGDEMEPTEYQLQPQLQKVFKRLGLNCKSILSPQTLLELCEVLCCGECAGRLRCLGQPAPALKVCSSFIEKILKDQLDSTSEEGEIEIEKTLFWMFVLLFGKGRSLFRNTDGSFGLSPEAAKPGDIISVVLGLGSLLILRPMGNNTYKIVGEPYYHGAMNGEALLGPLPDSFTAIWCRGKGIDYSAYFDENSGFLTTEDPRWPALPPSWRMIKREGGVPLFVDDETGEETKSHPSLTREGLEARGVKLEVFSII